MQSGLSKVLLNQCILFMLTLATCACTARSQTVGLACEPTAPVSVIKAYPEINHIQSVQQYAYICVEGQGLKVLDLSNPIDPPVVSSIEFLGVPYRMYIDGDLMYIGIQNHDYEVLDISDPASPVMIGSLQGVVSLVAVQDGIGVGFHDGVLSVYSLLGPGAPVQLSSIHESPVIYSVEFQEGMLYLGGRDSIFLYDLGDPVDPVLLTEFHLNEPSYDLLLNGTMLYVASRNEGVFTIDVGDPLNVQLLGREDTDGQAFGLDQYENSVYIADFTGGIRVLDISVPALPVFDGLLNTPGIVNNVHVTADYILTSVDNVGLVIFEQDTWKSSFVGQLQGISDSRHVTVFESIAYISSWQNGIYVVDVSDPNQPKLLNHISTFDAAIMTLVSGSHLYVADAYGGLLVYDITNRVFPELAGWYTSLEVVNSLEISGNLIFLSGGEDGIHIVDVSDPAFPRRFASYTTGNDYVTNVKVVGQTAYVALGREGMHVVDVTNPFQPVRVSEVDTTSYNMSDVGNYLHVAGFDFRSYDITDGNNPVLLGVHPINSRATGIATDDSYAFVPTWDGGMSVLDISDPLSIQELQVYPQDDRGEIKLVGEYLYCAFDGIEIYNAGSICTPCQPDLNADGTVNFLDVSVFIEAIGNHEVVADFNHDGSFNFLDVSAFLVAYAAGCP